jgi:hypothetical protein
MDGGKPGRAEMEPDKTAAEFDAGYYGKLLEKAWEETAFVFGQGYGIG